MYSISADTFEQLERNAWLPLERLTVSQWAEKHRVLTAGKTHHPGKWSNSIAPYLSGIMDSVNIPGVSSISVAKPSQIGVSEATRNICGYFASRYSDPVALVLPNQSKGRTIVQDFIFPLFTNTKCLSELLTSRIRDLKSEEIRLLNGFCLHLMWAGSPTSLASVPIRVVINDEIDLFETFTGSEMDPVQLSTVRTTSYGDRGLVINLSTPTTREGRIIQLVESADYKFNYVVPCPHCGQYQRLVFDNLKWEKETDESTEQLARRLKHNNAVWYECSFCKQRIEPAHRDEIVRRGKWSSVCGTYDDITKIERLPRRTSLGFYCGGLECLWLQWGDLASEFLSTKNTMEGLYNFRTKRLGEVFEHAVKKLPRNIFESKCQRAKLPEGKLPDNAVALIAGVDSQKDSFYLVLRAFAAGYPLRSQRVFHTRVQTFEDIERVCFRTQWGYANGNIETRIVDLLTIDTGGSRFDDVDGDISRTQQIYSWAFLKTRIKCIKGDSHAIYGRPFYWSYPTGKRSSPPLCLVNTQYYQDELHELIMSGEDNDKNELWQLNTHNDPDYNRMMSNIHKTARRKGQTQVYEWRGIGESVQLHYRDCEVYALLGAYLYGIHLMPVTDMPEQTVTAHQETNQLDQRGLDPWKIQPLQMR